MAADNNSVLDLGIPFELISCHHAAFGDTDPIATVNRTGRSCIHLGRLHDSIPKGWLSCGCGAVRVYECGLLGDLTIERPVNSDAWDLITKLDHPSGKAVSLCCATCRHRPAIGIVGETSSPTAKPLPGVSMCCVDCVDPDAAVVNLEHSRRGLAFSSVLLFSDTPPAAIPEWLEWRKISKQDLDGYNSFVLRDLHRHVHTPHVLTIESDARILHPGAWDNRWLSFDYIGAPWPAQASHAEFTRVGNSGLCLRSLRFLKATAELATDDNLKSSRQRWGRLLCDVFACHGHYRELAAQGMTWAPVDVAESFAREDYAPVSCFGVHGKKLSDRFSLKPAAVTAQTVAQFRNRNVNRPIPEHGMLSPAAQKVIQVEITDACPLRCSNCTRMVAHEPKPWTIDRESFMKAVDSLREFPGMIGIMGGEPTIHPDFAWMTEHAHSVLQAGRGRRSGLHPISDFNEYRERNLNSLHSRLGLWTSLGPGYRKHYELIQKVFDYQCINTHESRGLHQALLMSRRDLGVPDDVWKVKRDDCWIQRSWSASINDKGAYFCEIAAAIDRLFFNGRRAWKVEKDWWQRTPADFGEQLELCEFCTAPLSGPRRPDSDGRQDVTATTAKMLEQVGSPSAKRGQLVVHGPECLQADYRLTAENYLETEQGTRAARITSGHTSIHPNRLEGLVVCVGYGDALRTTAAFNRRQFDRLVVVTVPGDTGTIDAAKAAGAEVVLSERQHHRQSPFNKGAILNDGLRYMKPRGWLLLHDADILLPPTIREWVLGRVLNPGVLHWTSRYHSRSPDDTAALIENWDTVRRLTWDCEGADRKPWGYFHLVNVDASSLRGSLLMRENFPTAGSVDHEFMLRWPESHRVRIDDDSRQLSVVHIWHGPPANGWHAKRDDDRSLWQLVSLTAENHPWYQREVKYPCWIRVVRVSDASEHTIYARSPEDGPVIEYANGLTTFGLRGAAGGVAWGLSPVAGKQAWLWGGVPCSPSQYDIYQIGVAPNDQSS